jgi:membrane fusion protein (multidrug efflux system)
VLFVGGLGYFQLVFKPQMIKQFLSSQAPPPATITAEAAKTEEWIERLPAIGTLIASQGVEIASQVPGIVTAIGFESGQDLPVGTKLVQLDMPSKRPTSPARRLSCARPMSPSNDRPI